MIDSQHQTDSPLPQPEDGSRLAELLAGYLIASHCVAWPGVDGLIVDEMVGRYYLPASNDGHVPNPAELTRRHPDMAGAIVTFFERYRSPTDTFRLC
jgi:hypothetical protein